ncbi:MAG: D-alanyl-D-alanine carboxypeptidase [Butyricicoccus sp.]|nr:D-alanyl-D-alanine carboxypeptidase [Butyricicoccus sp.]
MKKQTIALALLFAALLAGQASAADISAKSAIVYEPVTGTVLYEKNADERMLVASTTKIMTALVALENCELDEQVPIKREYTAVEGSSMYLKPGESYTMEELLYGLMLASGNDAALAIAGHIAGGPEQYAELMNGKCDELGLENTHFTNPHGLDDPEHYSTARELALITAAAMENETFCKIFSTVTRSINGVSFKNHNKLLTICDGCTGGKTGYTDAAGRILVSSAERGGMALICVTISDPQDWDDHCALYGECYEKFRFVPALKADSSRVSVVSGTSEYVALRADVGGVVVPAGSAVTTETFLPSFVFAPVRAGERAGEVHISVDGDKLVIPVTYSQTVFIDGSIPLTPWERFKRAWYMASSYGVYYPSVG